MKYMEMNTRLVGSCDGEELKLEETDARRLPSASLAMSVCSHQDTFKPRPNVDAHRTLRPRSSTIGSDRTWEQNTGEEACQSGRRIQYAWMNVIRYDGVVQH